MEIPIKRRHEALGPFQCLQNSVQKIVGFIGLALLTHLTESKILSPIPKGNS